MSPPPRLAVIVDGVPLPEEEARIFWARFSEQDAHAGDLAGFARTEGFASVHPEAQRGVAVLVVSRSEAQRPYGAKDSSGSTHGSPGHQSGGRRGKKRR